MERMECINPEGKEQGGGVLTLLPEVGVELSN